MSIGTLVNPPEHAVAGGPGSFYVEVNDARGHRRSDWTRGRTTDFEQLVRLHAEGTTEAFRAFMQEQVKRYPQPVRRCA